MNEETQQPFDPFPAANDFGRSGKRPTVGADCVILTKRGGKWQILLIERGHEPFKGKWALPGGFMEWGESCEQAAARELHEETSLTDVGLELLGVFSKPGRDPRGTIISVSYIAIVDAAKAAQAAGGDDAARAAWFPLDSHPPLAFDHQDIADAAEKFLQDRRL